MSEKKARSSGRGAGSSGKAGSSAGSASNAAGPGKPRSSPPRGRRVSAPASEEVTRTQNFPEQERGPRGWLFPLLESSYTKLVPREQAAAEATADEAAAAVRRAGGTELFQSRLQPGRGESVLAAVPHDVWLDRLSEYKRRKVAAVEAAVLRAAVAPPGPVVPGQRNWAPLGPSVVMNGQAQGLPAVGGRVAGIAVAPGGRRIYAASANGGVFRSDDGGVSWRSLMDAFDLIPTQFASTCLACGAIAIDRSDPNRIYVGTGEGDTNSLFARRIVSALPAYRGIGPIRSDDGGATWISEATAAASPSLAGQAFFALAVDPGNPENVVGASTQGLYQRTLAAGGSPEWVQRRPGIHSSVAVSSAAGVTRFWAAEWGRGVFESSDGSSWSAVAAGFPTASVGRIALGVQSNNPDVVYAMVANTQGALLGVFRLDSGGAWKQIANPPDVLPTNSSGGSQGDYDLALAVDPSDANLIYLGGSFFADHSFWPASVWRCQIQADASGYRMTGTSIGVNAHADVHVLAHSPGDPNSLWVGCDGGLFLNRDPRGSGTFGSRNNGLACLCPNFFGQHPTDPNILFCGLQDNGTARTGGGPIWSHVNWGDGGYCLINWADPQQALVYANGTVYRSANGGLDHNSWVATTQFPWAMMTEPIVGTPYNPAQPGEARTVALGAGTQIHFSGDFGATWSGQVDLPNAGGIFAMVFASASRLYVGTTAGKVFRLDLSGGAWNATQIDNAPGGPLGLAGLVSGVAVDWADAALNSIYITFGGIGDYRHVWHFDGTRWEARSGPAGPGANNLLDVEHNAIEVDRQAPDHVYAGADIGVWHSPDRGQNWNPLPNGLPEAPVFDLQLHPTRRLLRASTHGRGLYESSLDP